MGKEVNERAVEKMQALRMAGMTNAEIAAALGVSRPTVVKHIGAQPELSLMQFETRLESETISRRLKSGTQVEVELGYFRGTATLMLDGQEMLIDEADMAEAAAFLWAAAGRMAAHRMEERKCGADEETAEREKLDAQ